MDEYIEREMALKAIDEYFHTTNPDGEEQIGVLKSRRVIRALPAADVAPVRHGRWLLITAGYRNFGWCCSECGRSVSINCDEELRQSKLEKEYPFCHCGARMDLEVTNDS